MEFRRVLFRSGELFKSAAGIVMVLFGCVLLGVGAIWTRKIIRVEY